MKISVKLATYGVVLALLQACAPGASARALKLVALGDSLTAGYGLKAGQGFTDALQRALRDKGYSVTVVNAGVSGDTAEDGLARYDWSVPPDANALLVELGANDMLRGMPVAGAKAALGQILARARKARLPTLLAGMRAAPNLGPDYRAAFDAIYPDLSAQYAVPLYPFFLEGVAADAGLNQPDGLHPNPQGVEIVVRNILPAVEALLDGAQ